MSKIQEAKFWRATLRASRYFAYIVAIEAGYARRAGRPWNWRTEGHELAKRMFCL